MHLNQRDINGTKVAKAPSDHPQRARGHHRIHGNHNTMRMSTLREKGR